MVLKNGSFASFIYSHDLKIMGWSQHWLGGNGQVLGITPIYAESADMLYLHVRRSDDTGVSSKEYLEVLQTRYFSAKHFVTDKAVYADCHVNILVLYFIQICKKLDYRVLPASCSNFRQLCCL